MQWNILLPNAFWLIIGPKIKVKKNLNFTLDRKIWSILIWKTEQTRALKGALKFTFPSVCWLVFHNILKRQGKIYNFMLLSENLFTFYLIAFIFAIVHKKSKTENANLKISIDIPGPVHVLLSPWSCSPAGCSDPSQG